MIKVGAILANFEWSSTTGLLVRRMRRQFAVTRRWSRQADCQEAPLRRCRQSQPKTRHVLAKRTYTGPSARRVGQGGSRAGFNRRGLGCLSCGAGCPNAGVRGSWWVGRRCAVCDRVRGGGWGGEIAGISASALSGWACRLGRGRVRQDLQCPFRPSDGSCRIEGACCSVRVGLMRLRVGIVQSWAVHVHLRVCVQ